MKRISVLTLGVVLVLSGCSSAPTAADKAKEEQIARLKESVCEITKATGKDALYLQDLADFYNNGIGPNDKNDPATANLFAISRKFAEDVEKLEGLVGKWTDSEGNGYLKFCNS